jgi:hypothetical protein
MERSLWSDSREDANGDLVYTFTKVRHEVASRNERTAYLPVA